MTVRRYKELSGDCNKAYPYAIRFDIMAGTGSLTRAQMMGTKKSWREKLADDKGLPKVIERNS